VHGIESDANRAAIARSIIQIGKSFDLTVVAEGVETDGERELLRELQSDLIQGFQVARPIAAADLPGWLARHGVQAAPRDRTGAAAAWSGSGATELPTSPLSAGMLPAPPERATIGRWIPPASPSSSASAS
jgi:predicted signal transduction protein with EAL and GGDEF domain